MDMTQLIFINSIVLLGAVCQGSIGMGFGLIASPLLILIDPGFVPAPMIMCGFTLSVLIMLRNRKATDFNALKFSLIGRFIGTVIAVSVIIYISQEAFSLVFGAIIILAVFLSIIKADWELTPFNLFGAGLASGIMATLTSIGSPPMGLLLQKQKGSVLRGTLSGFFTVGAGVSVLFLAFVGKVTAVEGWLFLQVLPALLLGFLLSRYSIRFLDKGYTRALILAISALGGLSVIIKTIINYI